MRSTACLIGLSLLAGCVGSLLPIYGDEDLIFDPGLLGVWAADDSSGVYIVTPGTGLSYSVEYIDDSCDRGTFVMHLASIGGFRFLDVAVEPIEDWPLIPVHGFALIDEQADSTVTLRQLDYEWLDDYLKTEPEAIAQVQMDSYPFLTAATADLQRFHLAHRLTPNAYHEPVTLTRLNDEAAERLGDSMKCPIGGGLITPAAATRGGRIKSWGTPSVSRTALPDIDAPPEWMLLRGWGVGGGEAMRGQGASPRRKCR